MRFLILTFLFTLPFAASAASFDLAAPDLAVGESAQITLSITSSEESVYTAEAIVSFDETVLDVNNVSVANGWMQLSQPGYDSISNGRIVKTAGRPGGVTSQTPFLTFTVTRLTSATGVITIEGTSKLYNKDSVNIASSFDTQVFPAIQNTIEVLPSLPPAFVVSEVTSNETSEIIVEEVSTPIEEVVDTNPLPAAVITFQGDVPYIPMLVALLILLAGTAVYFIIRSGRKNV